MQPGMQQGMRPAFSPPGMMGHSGVAVSAVMQPSAPVMYGQGVLPPAASEGPAGNPRPQVDDGRCAADVLLAKEKERKALEKEKVVEKKAKPVHAKVQRFDKLLQQCLAVKPRQRGQLVQEAARVAVGTVKQGPDFSELLSQLSSADAAQKPNSLGAPLPHEHPPAPKKKT